MARLAKASEVKEITVCRSEATKTYTDGYFRSLREQKEILMFICGYLLNIPLQIQGSKLVSII